MALAGGVSRFVPDSFGTRPRTHDLCASPPAHRCASGLTLLQTLTVSAVLR
jgi:hypothetical protein